MNVFSKVTIKSLKKNRTRTIVTIIGIMLSAAMICAVTTFISSLQNYALGYAVYKDGDWHGEAINADSAAYTNISTSDEVEKATYNQRLGYAKIDSQNELKPYIYVIAGQQENYFDMLPIHMISGNLPENSGELIIPEHILTNAGMKYEIGDTIMLSLGDEPSDEFFEVREEKSYKIVGIYEKPSFEEYESPGYTAITVSDGAADSYNMDIYYKMKRPSEVYGFMQKLGLEGAQNRDVLMFQGVSEFDSFIGILINLSVIVILLIMFGSVALIYNAFAISVSERTKQFGLLSSIGATKKQLKKSVIFEALAVSAIGIPLGIGVGIAGIGITLLIIGNKFATILGSYEAPLRLCVSWEAIAIAIVIALVTVLISAWIPSKRATKVTAVEAIRQNTDIKVNNKSTKTSKITYKLFGLPGVLASKYYKRNKKKYRTTVVSLFMSIVLFVVAATFTDYLTESVRGGFGSNDYELRYMTYLEFEDKSVQEMMNILTSDENITRGAYTISRRFDGLISEQYVTDQIREVGIKDRESGDYSIRGTYNFISDDEFALLLDTYSLDKDIYYNPEDPVGLVIDSDIVFDVRQEKFITLDTLNSDRSEITCVYMIDESNVSFKLKTAKTITEYPFYINKGVGNYVNIIYPVSMMRYAIPEYMQDENSINFYLQSENHKASYKNLLATLIENNMSIEGLFDYAEQEEQSRNVVTIIQVFSYGFIVLISLIAAANVFNTISTNINLRRREFAMLKSVGMTQKGFNKMMNFECILYGSKALVVGLPVSTAISYLIYIAVSGGYETSYRLPWKSAGIATLSVFLVVFATMLYSMSKIKKDNPIDALKNENL